MLIKVSSWIIQYSACIVLTILFSNGCKTVPQPELADIIYTNGNIITMQSEGDVAKSIAVKNGRILAIDTENLTSKYQGENTLVVDLHKKTLLPGFIDAHSHISLGMATISLANLSSPPVSSVKSISDIITKLSALQEKRNIAKGEWILGWGYDPDLLEENRHPNKLDLDKVFPDHPVYLLHVSGHMAVVNSLALKKIGIDASSSNPPGGMIVRLVDSDEPNGLLQETAMYLVQQHLPKPTLEQSMALLEATQNLYASHGITTAQDGFTDYKNFQFLTQAATAGKLKLDIEVLAGFVNLGDYYQNHGEDFGKRKNGLRLAGVKVVSDGSPQGKTAFFSQPYLTQVPGCTHQCKGFPNVTKEQLKDIMRRCYERDVQLFTHANGDGAIDLFLDAHEEVIDSMDGVPSDLRNVIIHSQFVRPDQLELYKKHQMIPAFFTNHAFFWGDTHLDNLGKKRANFLSPMKTAMEMGIVSTNHTDFPVTPIDQLFLLNTAVNRSSRSGKIIGESERISVYQGLQAITINAAYQHKQEHLKGSIKVGKLADFVILNENPLTVTLNKIKDIQVLQTIKEGKVIFTNPTNAK